MALPIDTTAWATAVDAVKIGNVPLRHVSLGDMSARSFSGSTIPHATCLQLRALWPPARRPYQARADLELDDDSGTLPLFNSDDASLAESLLDNSPRLDHFLSVMALRDGPDDDDPFPPSTPIVSRSTLRNADKLGMFGPSVTSWRRLRLFQEAPREQRLLFTPKARPGPAAQFLLSHNVSKLDLKKPVQQAPSDGEDHSSSDTEDGSSASLWTSFERLALSPCSPSVTTKRNAATSAPAREQPSGAGLLATPQPSLAAAVSQPRRVYSGRTEYEVQTSHFFVTYVDTLLSHALSLDLVNHISVVPQEKRYKFGAQANPEASTSGQKDCLFVACPDGAIYANLGPGRRKAYMFFELKPFRRDQMARGRLICREETAEMAAIMYEEYVAGGRQLEDTQTYRQFMVSLDKDQFWLISVSFTGKYLNYLSDPRNTVGKDSMDEEDFVTFQQYGPFGIENRYQMRLINIVIVAAAIAQLQETSSGRALLQRLRAEVAG